MCGGVKWLHIYCIYAIYLQIKYKDIFLQFSLTCIISRKNKVLPVIVHNEGQTAVNFDQKFCLRICKI